jgi:hypothetical protein
MNEKLPAKIAQLHQQRLEILNEPPEQALDRILHAESPAALVHAFPEQDFYHLVHDIGPEDALPLLSLASDRQWEYLLDIESWRRDRIDLTAVTRWLDRLHRADPRRTIRYLVEKKIEFLEFYLFRNLEVRIRETDQDPTEFGADYFSRDSVFYVRPGGELLNEDSNLSDIDRTRLREFINELIESLADHDHITYQKILLETMSVLPAEIEEEAFRLRNVRLAEKGLVPFDEALGIYQPLRPAELKTRSRKTPPSEEVTRVPLYPSGAMQPDNVFSESLARIDVEAVLRPLQVEFAGLCNRIIVADHHSVRRKQDLQRVVQKACGYLSIGLQALATEKSRDRTPALPHLSALQKHLLTDIFRLGFGQALALKWETQKWLDQAWFAEQGLSLTFWGEEWMGVLGGLLIKKPLFFDNFRSGDMYRDFRTIEEINRTRAELEAVTAFDHLLSLTDLQPHALASQRFLTYKNLLLTAWAHRELTLPPEPGPLPLEKFRKFYETLWQPGPPPRKIRPAAKTAFRQWFAGRTGLREQALDARVGDRIETLFQEIEDEFGHVAPADLNPRYVLLFVVGL